MEAVKDRPSDGKSSSALAGRVDPQTYVTHCLFSGMMMLGVFFGVGLLLLQLDLLDTYLGAAIMVATVLAAVLADIPITVKRLHDLGRPGWHCCLLLVPGYNVYLAGILAFRGGTLGANMHGTDPQQAGLNSVEVLHDEAYRHEMNGDWDRALRLYNVAAEQAETTDLEYVLNSRARVQEKMRLSGESTSA